MTPAGSPGCRCSTARPSARRRPPAEPPGPPAAVGPGGRADASPEALRQLSVPVLIAGFIAITALELGRRLASPLIKLCVADRGTPARDHHIGRRSCASGARRGRGCRSIAPRACSGWPGWRQRGRSPRAGRCGRPRAAVVTVTTSTAAQTAVRRIWPRGGASRRGSLVAELLLPCGSALRLGAVDGEDRQPAVVRRLRPHRLREPAARGHDAPHRRRRELVLFRRGIEPGSGSGRSRAASSRWTRRSTRRRSARPGRRPGCWSSRATSSACTRGSRPRS